MQKIHPACCAVLHSTSPTATRVLVYTFQNPEGAQLSVRVARGFHYQFPPPDHYSTEELSYVPAKLPTGAICSDHTKMGVVMPAHVVTEARINLNTGHQNGFPGHSCSSLHGAWIIPSPPHCAGGRPESPCPALSSQLSCLSRGGRAAGRTRVVRRVSCGADSSHASRVARRAAGWTGCAADGLHGGRAAVRTGCAADGLQCGRVAGRKGCWAEVLRGARAARRTGCWADRLPGGARGCSGNEIC